MSSAAVENKPGVSKARRAQPFGHIGRIRRYLAPAVARPFAIAETVALVLVTLALSGWAQPDDPLMLGAGFPWLWLLPLLVALRYGSLLGVFAGALMLGAWSLLYRHGEPFPAVFVTGGLIQILLAGHFGDTWGSRAERATSLNDYLNDRLVALTNSHYLIRLSHERLERDLLARPTTLRDSIMELRRLSVTPQTADAATEKGYKRNPLPGATDLLKFVAQACQIEVAALHLVRDGRPDTRPVAQIGEPFELDVRNELVIQAIDTQGLAHLRSVDSAIMDSPYLVCAPLVGGEGGVRGLLVVKRMPFLSLNPDNLEMLLVLIGYYADGLGHAPPVQRILEQVPACPYDFALELSRLARLRRRAAVESSLVALVFPNDEGGRSLFEHVMRHRRSLDVPWHVETGSHTVMVNLMPSTDRTGIDGYLARIEARLKAQFNTDLEHSQVGVHSLRLDDEEPGAALLRLLKRSGVDV